MLDYALFAATALLLLVLVVLQRRYERKLKEKQRLSDRLWVQAIQDMKKSAERKRYD